MGVHASVIIPAHDEETSLPGSLRALLADPDLQLEVVVVANGCTDRTADVARRLGVELSASVRVASIDQASKTAAMNVGDDMATAFPRIYLDADVTCHPATLRGLVEALDGTKHELAVATRELNLTSASWWVSRYYRAWQQLPRVQAELSGRGAYAFSRSGRARFDRFPSITADDYWAVRQVPRALATITPDPVIIRPPVDLRTLVRVRSRIYAANRVAGVPTGTPSSGSADLWFLLRRPRRWVDAGVFLITNAYVKLVRRRHHGDGRDAVRGSDSR